MARKATADTQILLSDMQRAIDRLAALGQPAPPDILHVFSRLRDHVSVRGDLEGLSQKAYGTQGREDTVLRSVSAFDTAIQSGTVGEVMSASRGVMRTFGAAQSRAKRAKAGKVRGGSVGGAEEMALVNALRDTASRAKHALDYRDTIRSAADSHSFAIDARTSLEQYQSDFARGDLRGFSNLERTAARGFQKIDNYAQSARGDGIKQSDVQSYIVGSATPLIGDIGSVLRQGQKARELTDAQHEATKQDRDRDSKAERQRSYETRQQEKQDRVVQAGKRWRESRENAMEQDIYTGGYRREKALARTKGGSVKQYQATLNSTADRVAGIGQTLMQRGTIGPNVLRNLRSSLTGRTGRYEQNALSLGVPDSELDPLRAQQGELLSSIDAAETRNRRLGVVAGYRKAADGFNGLNNNGDLEQNKAMGRRERNDARITERQASTQKRTDEAQSAAEQRSSNAIARQRQAAQQRELHADEALEKTKGGAYRQYENFLGGSGKTLLGLEGQLGEGKAVSSIALRNARNSLILGASRYGANASSLGVPQTKLTALDASRAGLVDRLDEVGRNSYGTGQQSRIDYARSRLDASRGGFFTNPFDKVGAQMRGEFKADAQNKTNALLKELVENSKREFELRKSAMQRQSRGDDVGAQKDLEAADELVGKRGDIKSLFRQANKGGGLLGSIAGLLKPGGLSSALAGAGAAMPMLGSLGVLGGAAIAAGTAAYAAGGPARDEEIAYRGTGANLGVNGRVRDSLYGEGFHKTRLNDDILRSGYSTTDVNGLLNSVGAAGVQNQSGLAVAGVNMSRNRGLELGQTGEIMGSAFRSDRNGGDAGVMRIMRVLDKTMADGITKGMKASEIGDAAKSLLEAATEAGGGMLSSGASDRLLALQQNFTNSSDAGLRANGGDIAARMNAKMMDPEVAMRGLTNQLAKGEMAKSGKSYGRLMLGGKATNKDVKTLNEMYRQNEYEAGQYAMAAGDGTYQRLYSQGGDAISKGSGVGTRAQYFRSQGMTDNEAARAVFQEMQGKPLTEILKGAKSNPGALSANGGTQSGNELSNKSLLQNGNAQQITLSGSRIALTTTADIILQAQGGILAGTDAVQGGANAAAPFFKQLGDNIADFFHSIGLGGGSGNPKTVSWNGAKGSSSAQSNPGGFSLASYVYQGQNTGGYNPFKASTGPAPVTATSSGAVTSGGNSPSAGSAAGGYLGKITPVPPTSGGLAAVTGFGNMRPSASMLASPAFKDPKFMAANYDASLKLGVNDFDMLASLALESGLDPKVANRSGTNNHGLFQIGPGALADMRKRDPSIKARTPAEFAAMYSASQQAKFYGDYLKMKGVKSGASFDDIRMATLFPAAIGKQSSYVLFGKNAAIASYRPGSGGIGADSYKNHASMDGAIDGVRDGSITKGEAATFYRKSAASYFNRTPPAQFTPSGNTAQQNVNVTVTVMGEIKGAKNVVIATRQTNASQPRGRG